MFYNFMLACFMIVAAIQFVIIMLLSVQVGRLKQRLRKIEKRIDGSSYSIFDMFNEPLSDDEGKD